MYQIHIITAKNIYFSLKAKNQQYFQYNKSILQWKLINIQMAMEILIHVIMNQNLIYINI